MFNNVQIQLSTNPTIYKLNQLQNAQSTNHMFYLSNHLKTKNYQLNHLQTTATTNSTNKWNLLQTTPSTSPTISIYNHLKKKKSCHLQARKYANQSTPTSINPTKNKTHHLQIEFHNYHNLVHCSLAGVMV